MEIVLFNRKLTRKIAGGARAVFDRAAVYVKAGHGVSMVFTEFLDDGGRALQQLRDDGILHPNIKVLRFWRDAVPAEAYQAAHALPLIRCPDETDARPGDEQTLRGEGQPQEAIRFSRKNYRGGAPKVFEYLDAMDAVRERWRFDRLGRLLTVDDFDTDGTVLRRRFYVMGRMCWLDVDMTLSEGRGEARYAPAVGLGPATFATVVARWLDRRYQEARTFVCIADGENTSQHVLRAMQHPGVRGVSVLHNCHTVFPHGSHDPVKEHWKPFLDNLNNVQQMVCLTEKQLFDLRSLNPGLPLRVVHHAASEPKLPPVRRDPMLAVFVGRLGKQKQLSHTLQAFALVVSRVPSARLDMYGEGPERAAVEAQIEELGLRDSVRLMGFTDRPAEAFASAAVAVMTSLYEGLPLTLTEAMAVGTPFVAYDLNYGPAEVISDGHNGFLVAQNDIEAFAERVADVLENAPLRQRLSSNAKAVLMEFSSESYKREWLDVANAAVRASGEGVTAGDSNVDVQAGEA